MHDLLLDGLSNAQNLQGLQYRFADLQGEGLEYITGMILDSHAQCPMRTFIPITDNSFFFYCLIKTQI